MNITIFNRDYTLRRFAPDGSYEDMTVNIHMHEQESGGGTPWSEQKGIVKQAQGHGMVPIREASLADGTRADRVLYRGRWYECTSCTLYDHTALSHYNYSFIALPEDAIETITVFNHAFDESLGYDVLIPTVIRGASWTEQVLTTQETLGVKGASKFTINIPEEADFSGKIYVDPMDYAGVRGTFTFRPGDIAVRGAEDSPCTVAALMKKYGTVAKVAGVFDFRTAPNARHWRLEGE